MDDDAVKYSIAGNAFWGESHTHSYREKGPSIIYNNGTVYFSTTAPGVSNREKGPGYISSNGFIAYIINGDTHRIDGPAIIREDGIRRYFVNGEELPQLEFFAIYGVM